jgi:hypothetical protein
MTPYAAVGSAVQAWGVVWTGRRRIEDTAQLRLQGCLEDLVLCQVLSWGLRTQRWCFQPLSWPAPDATGTSD